jgi:hypothetical protein
VLRVLIRHAIDIWMAQAQSIVRHRRPKANEVRAWTDAELAIREA